MKTYLIIIGGILAIVFGNLVSLNAAGNSTNNAASLPQHEVRYKNKTKENVYVWQYYVDKSCKDPVNHIVVRGEENKAMTYINTRMYIRVTTTEDSCASASISRWVGDKDETIEIP